MRHQHQLQFTPAATLHADRAGLCPAGQLACHLLERTQAFGLGQMIGFVADGLPPAAQEAFAQLQQDVPPMAPSLAEQVVVEELGDRPEVLFLEWDPVPVAAASIGGRLAGVLTATAASGVFTQDLEDQEGDDEPEPEPSAKEAELADAAQLASLADETPEGRSIVVLAMAGHGLEFNQD